MAINKRIMEKIRERAEGDERTLSFLRDHRFRNGWAGAIRQRIREDSA